MTNQYPVVLVHGLFGYGPKEMLGFDYWGQAIQVDSPLQRFEASLGPISSSHDRACELYAQIKGVQVDYGEDHARVAEHNRYGNDFTGKGFYPQWSEQNPIHLVGHSLGGPTMRMLQYLLEKKFWGPGTNANWIRSISGISPVFNGSTLAYFLGCNEQTGMVSGPIGNFLAKTLEIIAGAIGSNLERLYDFDLGQWGLVRQSSETLTEYLGRIGNSPLFKGKDNAAYDLTLQAMLTQNQLIATFPGTHYFSYVTEQTHALPFSHHYWPDTGMNPMLYGCSAYMGMRPFGAPFYAGFNGDDWRENDGAVSSYSQMYPRIAGNHPVAGEFTDASGGFEPGKWYWQYLHDRDHLDVVMLPEPWQVAWQKMFYSNLFQRLAALR